MLFATMQWRKEELALRSMEGAMTTRTMTDRESIAELLEHDHYTPEDLAELLDMDAWAVRRAARSGELPAFIVDHHVLCIRREDAVQWLARRLGRD
jgi:hypothetical protein